MFVVDKLMAAMLLFISAVVLMGGIIMMTLPSWLTTERSGLPVAYGMSVLSILTLLVVTMLDMDFIKSKKGVASIGLLMASIIALLITPIGMHRVISLIGSILILALGVYGCIGSYREWRLFL